MEGAYTGIRYVHGAGKVEAKVWYSKKEEMELTEVSLMKTGNEEKKYTIKINNFEINLYKSVTNFEKYDTISEDKKIKLFYDFYLPISVRVSTNYELKEIETSITKEEAENLLIEKLKLELLEEIGNETEINDIQINTNNTENKVEVEVIYEVIEEIGTEEKIVY